MRKRLFPCVFLLAATLLCVALPSTSYPLSSAIPTEFTVSPDGTATVRVSVVSSVGYVRDCRIDTRDDGLYLTFYSTYGLNNPNGARDTFTISCPQNAIEFSPTAAATAIILSIKSILKPRNGSRSESQQAGGGNFPPPACFLLLQRLGEAVLESDNAVKPP